MLQTFLRSFQTREKSNGKVRMSSAMFPLICLENEHQAVRRKDVFFSRIWQIWKKEKKKSYPGEARRWEWEGSCSCVYNEVTADVMWANPTSNLWEGYLWQQANFSKKKQTFQPINGLIVWIKLKHYKDLLLGAPSTWLQEAEGAVGGLLTGAKLHPDVWNCRENVTAARAVTHENKNLKNRVKFGAIILKSCDKPTKPQLFW